MLNPSLTVFVLAVCTYSITVTLYAQHFREDYWQDHIISFALLTSTICGLDLGYDLQTTILSIVSWAVIAALLFSSATHKVVRRYDRLGFQSTREQETCGYT